MKILENASLISYSKGILQLVNFYRMVLSNDVNNFFDIGLTLKLAEKILSQLIRKGLLTIENSVKKKIPLDIPHSSLGKLINVHMNEDFFNEKSKIE